MTPLPQGKIAWVRELTDDELASAFFLEKGGLPAGLRAFIAKATELPEGARLSLACPRGGSARWWRRLAHLREKLRELEDK